MGYKQKKRLKPEALFSKELCSNAPYFKCSWTVIEDPKGINESNRHKHRELKRPCDGIFNSPDITRMLELKIDYRPLMDHQLEKMLKENEVRPGSYLCVRKIRLKHQIKYRVDVWKREKGKYNNKAFQIILFECNDLMDLFKFLMTWQIGGSI